MNKTAIVILSWNGIDYLKMFLGNVIKHSINPETFVCVADNGSTDGSAEWVALNFKDVKLIRFDKNHGFAGGYNLALKQLDARYFVLLNSDIEVTEGWLQPLVNFMDKNLDVASCQPKILSYYRKDHFEYAGAAGSFIDKYGYPFCRGRIFNKIEQDTGQYDSQIDVFWTSGACMLVRRDAWEKCDGFDSDFFAHMEEIDLCWRFSKAGYRVCYLPESAVYHIGGGSLPYDSPFKTYLNFRNSLFVLYKNLPDNKLHSYLFKRKILDGLAAIMFLSKVNFGSFRSVWKAHIDYYKAINKLRVKRKIVKKLEVNHFEPPILNKSIVFEFYIKGNKTYNSLRIEN
ncbi:MAG TPA: glycosyltransferase family 2 protein [Bacteroidales bacterium]|nr:glycosyltransferase family 2 protein [Bacteroidales bacterium]